MNTTTIDSNKSSNALLAFSTFSIIATIALALGSLALSITTASFMAIFAKAFFFLGSAYLPYGYALLGISFTSSLGITYLYSEIIKLITQFITLPIMDKLAATEETPDEFFQAY